MITAPGLYFDVEESTYHGDSDLAPQLGPSLSQSGAKTLLTNPARFAWEREHGRPAKDAFDIGSLIHALALRGGDNRLRVVDAYDWRAKVTQQAKADAYSAGLIPVHRGDLREASKVAQAVRRDEMAGAILSAGRPEVSAYAVDPETGVTLRARFDWLRDGTGVDCICDLKTAAYGRGTPDAFGKSAAAYDYPVQAWWYRYVFFLITGRWVPFYTITVETQAPYFVTVGQYSDFDLATGEERGRTAIREYAERRSTGLWTLNPVIHTFDLPGWYGRTA
ncbi:PD-(D/E)XK nuclease-like domain-containing protein [Terrabacter sp. NPDC000476]|uniref:PD-(D/E)XK nuclease-like domain-containing protein n=1 Tax=Terrabacter sp. NPDC000476 TaxID=3154258 RepID=UPI00331C4543